MFTPYLLYISLLKRKPKSTSLSYLSFTRKFQSRITEIDWADEASGDDTFKYLRSWITRAVSYGISKY